MRLDVSNSDVVFGRSPWAEDRRRQ